MLRNYDVSQAVREHYREMRTKQTPEFVEYVKKKYSYSSPINLYSWEDLLDALSRFVDVSDPDLTLPNEVHLFQTAEKMREDGKPDWMQVVGVLHDIGKCIYLRGCDEDGTSLKKQFAIAGDTWVVGYPLPVSAIFPEFQPAGEKREYKPGCGLRNCLVSYGHDEYLFNILENSELPVEALYMVRFHSLYPWHAGGAYTELEDDLDREMKPWVQEFNKYDLYTKRDVPYTEEELRKLREHYLGLIHKFLPREIMI